MDTTLVLLILGGVGPVLGFSSYSPELRVRECVVSRELNRIQSLSSSYSLSYLLSGGGDYRGIYGVGLKRGFYGVYRPFIECPLQER
jgi:hypothetical protein